MSAVTFQRLANVRLQTAARCMLLFSPAAFLPSNPVCQLHVKHREKVAVCTRAVQMYVQYV